MYTAEYFKDSQGNPLSPEEIALMLNGMGKTPPKPKYSAPPPSPNPNLIVARYKTIPVTRGLSFGISIDRELAAVNSVGYQELNIPKYENNIVEEINRLTHDALRRNATPDFITLGIDVFLTLQDQQATARVYSISDSSTNGGELIIHTTVGGIGVIVVPTLGVMQLGFKKYTEAIRML